MDSRQALSHWWMQIFWTLYLSVVAFIPNFFCMCKCWIFCQVPQSSGNFSVPLRNKVDCVPAISKASNISSWQSAVCSLSNHICSDKLWWTGYLKFRYWILFFATIMVWFQHACQHCVFHQYLEQFLLWQAPLQLGYTK